LRSAIRAKELLGLVYSTELDAPILPREDPRWGRLRSGLDPGVNLRDRFRGALIGGAIGDAMGRPNEGRPTEVARERKLRAYQPWHVIGVQFWGRCITSIISLRTSPRRRAASCRSRLLLLPSSRAPSHALA
jgi:hypothetical protein